MHAGLFVQLPLCILCPEGSLGPIACEGGCNGLPIVAPFDTRHTGQCLQLSSLPIPEDTTKSKQGRLHYDLLLLSGQHLAVIVQPRTAVMQCRAEDMTTCSNRGRGRAGESVTARVWGSWGSERGQGETSSSPTWLPQAGRSRRCIGATGASGSSSWGGC